MQEEELGCRRENWDTGGRIRIRMDAGGIIRIRMH